jgi:hypothetical protein
MPSPTVLAVLTVVRVGFVRDALSLMIRVPARPSRPKLISIPSARRGVCARRSRPASCGFFQNFEPRPGSHCLRSPAFGHRHVLYGDLLLAARPRGNKNALKHGLYTREATEERRRLRALMQQSRMLIQDIE